MEKLIKNIFIYTLAGVHFLTYSTQGLAATYPLTYNPQATKLIVQSIDASNEEFQKFLDAHPEFESLEERRPLVNKKSISQLYTLKQLAEAEFMSEEPQKAFELYKNLVAMALQQDWEQSEREVIFTAFFRMAQLKPEEQNKWIKKAIAFDNTLTPNTELIPLSLQESFTEQKNNFASEQLHLKLDVKATYYVNGVKNLTQVDPESLYRITYISNVYGIKTEMAKGSLIPDLFPFSTPLVQGECQKQNTISALSYSHIQANLKDSFVFSSTQCSPLSLASVKTIKSPSSAQEESQLAEVLPTKTTPTETIALSLYPSSVDTTAFDSTPDPLKLNNKQKMSPAKKRWIIILSSAAAIGLGAFLIHKHNESNNPRPAQTEDF